MNLKDQTILVTGGAVRIGAAIADALAAAGARPVIHYRESRTQAQELSDGLRSRYGVTAPIIHSPLDTEAQCRELIQSALAAAGRLDGLINNAAVFHKNPLRETDRALLELEFRVNLMAPVSLTRAFAEIASGGAVINLLDRRVRGQEAGCLPYLLSKKSLADFTKIAALELAPRVRVNAVAPGAVLPPPDKPGVSVRDLAGHVPLDIQVKPADVADAVIYLLSASSVTGQILFVDGGRHLV